MANTTWNPSDKSATVALSGGNLTATASANGVGVRASDAQLSGKFYWEYTATTVASGYYGVSNRTPALGNIGSGGLPFFFSVISTGAIYVDGVSTGVSLGAISNGNVICFAIDLTARLGWIRIGAAGNWNNSGTANPATGAGGIAITLGKGLPAYPAISMANTGVCTANFGDSAFAGTVPSGFTSGFTAGTTIPLNALLTQEALEHWTSNGDAQITQLALEHWVNPSSGNVQAVMTQIALEHWTSVADAGSGGGSNTRAMILA